MQSHERGTIIILHFMDKKTKVLRVEKLAQR